VNEMKSNDLRIELLEKIVSDMDDRTFALEAKIDALETRAIRRLEMVEEAVFSKPAPEPETVTISKAAFAEAIRQIEIAQNRMTLQGTSWKLMDNAKRALLMGEISHDE
jgi:hypothetical protein